MCQKKPGDEGKLLAEGNYQTKHRDLLISGNSLYCKKSPGGSQGPLYFSRSSAASGRAALVPLGRGTGSLLPRATKSNIGFWNVTPAGIFTLGLLKYNSFFFLIDSLCVNFAFPC